jgi:hypothetical protein
VDALVTTVTILVIFSIDHRAIIVVYRLVDVRPYR